MDGLAALVLLFIVALAACLALLWWRDHRTSHRLAQMLASGVWRQEACPACNGRGCCLQCGGMGTLGLMGKPCPACGGGEQEENGRQVTLRGTGRCSVCGGSGQVYRDSASGNVIRIGE